LRVKTEAENIFSGLLNDGLFFITAIVDCIVDTITVKKSMRQFGTKTCK
jgi:hypothetical protein